MTGHEMSGRTLAAGFRDVDSQSDIDRFRACLRMMEGLPSFRAYKDHLNGVARLRSGRYLDVACGLADDAMRLADLLGDRGSVVAIDLSARLLQEAADAARARKLDNIAFSRMDAAQLAFADGQFDVARIDRALQHVDDPSRVLAELRRVVKPGGLVVAAEPDWGTFLITDADGAADDVCAAFAAGIRTPHIGRRLPTLFIQAGLTVEAFSGFVLLTSGLGASDVIFDLKTTCAKLDAAEGTTRYRDWFEQCRGARPPNLVNASVSLFVACGVVG
jgi:ubiquinone/menaquinone biosynthesis C-methylase UbiE